MFPCMKNDKKNGKMSLDLYYIPASPPCRAVLLTAKALGLKLNLIYTDILTNQQFSPKFLKMNPQHCIPTLSDNGFTLWESRSIMRYLVAKYGRKDSLYPKDLKKRALVDQKLDFDLGMLYPRFADYYYPVMFAGANFDPAKYEKCQEAFKLFDIFLEDTEYAAGNNLTIADFSLAATVSSYDVLKFDLKPYRNVVRWYSKVKTISPGYEDANGRNVMVFKELAESLLKGKI